MRCCFFPDPFFVFFFVLFSPSPLMLSSPLQFSQASVIRSYTKFVMGVGGQLLLRFSWPQFYDMRTHELQFPGREAAGMHVCVCVTAVVSCMWVVLPFYFWVTGGKLLKVFVFGVRTIPWEIHSDSRSCWPTLDWVFKMIEDWDQGSLSSNITDPNMHTWDFKITISPQKSKIEIASIFCILGNEMLQVFIDVSNPVIRVACCSIRMRVGRIIWGFVSEGVDQEDTFTSM